MKNLNFSSSLMLDQLAGGDLHGWASVAEEEASQTPALQNETVRLRLGETIVAEAHRLLARPDVDQLVGQPDIPKGFRLPVAPLIALSQLAGPAVPASIAVEFGATRLPLLHQPGRLRDLSLYRMLTMADPGYPLTLADLWFANDAQLNIRVAAVGPAFGANPPYVVRLFQPECGDGNTLRLLSENTVRAEGLGFLTANLPNPFLPLLLTVSAANNQTLCMDAILFPSLCRGGAHHAELQAAGGTAGYLADLRNYSGSLLNAFLAGPETGAGKPITGLSIDMRGATGGERLLQPAALRWLALTHGLDIKGTEADPELARITAEAGITPDHVTRGGDLRLRLPADGLPTLSSLAFRAPPRAGGRTAVPFLTANTISGVPGWYVSLPMDTGWLTPLQPQTRPMAYPLLSATGVGGLGEAVSDAPFAIRFTDESRAEDETRLFPLTAESEEGRFGIEDATMTVIVPVRDAPHHFAALLASLAGQTMIDRVEVLVIDNRSTPAGLETITQAIGAILPGKARILTFDQPFNHSAEINLAAANAAGQILCTIDSDVVLHDPYTLEALGALAAHPRVGTAGCLLVEGKPGAPDSIRHHAAGLFPTGLAFGGRPRICWSEPNSGKALGPATYPVAANSFTVSAFRRDLWLALGGLADDRLPADHNDTDFGLRVLAAGFTNLCTTAISAFHTGRATRGPSFDSFAPAHIQTANLARLLAGTTVMRRIM